MQLQLSWDMLASHCIAALLGILTMLLLSRDSSVEAFAITNMPKIKKLQLFNNAPRHDVRSGDSADTMEMDPEEMKIQQAFAEHQQNAPKLGWATDVRTLVEYNHGFAVMSTISKS